MHQPMSAIAERIDRTLHSLPPEQAGKLEALLSQLLAFAQPPGAGQAVTPRPAPYRTQPQPLGLQAGLSYEKWTELLDAAEGPGWK